jgi:hypothetical protein
LPPLAGAILSSPRGNSARVGNPPTHRGSVGTSAEIVPVLKWSTATPFLFVGANKSAPCHIPSDTFRHMLVRGWPLRASKTRIRKSSGTALEEGNGMFVTVTHGLHPPGLRATLRVCWVPALICTCFITVLKPGDFTLNSYVPGGRSKDNIPSLFVHRFGRALGRGSISTSAFGTMPPLTSVTKSTIEPFWGACSACVAWAERACARTKMQKSRGMRRYCISEKLARTDSLANSNRVASPSPGKSGGLNGSAQHLLDPSTCRSCQGESRSRGLIKKTTLYRSD